MTESPPPASRQSHAHHRLAIAAQRRSLSLQLKQLHLKRTTQSAYPAMERSEKRQLEFHADRISKAHAQHDDIAKADRMARRIDQVLQRLHIDIRRIKAHITDYIFANTDGDDMGVTGDACDDLTAALDTRVEWASTLCMLVTNMYSYATRQYLGDYSILHSSATVAGEGACCPVRHAGQFVYGTPFGDCLRKPSHALTVSNPDLTIPSLYHSMKTTTTLLVGEAATQYFLVGFGSHWSMGHDTDPVQVTKFEERIAVINGSLPSGEPPWVLASPSTPAKTAAMLAFFDSTLIELRAHPDVAASEFPLVADDHPGFSSDNAWAGGKFYVGDGSPVYTGAPIHIDLQKIEGVWTFGDGTTLAADDARWVSPNPAEDRAIIMSNGGEWGSNAVSSQAGKVRGWSSSKLKTVAIYERTVTIYDTDNAVEHVALLSNYNSDGAISGMGELASSMEATIRTAQLQNDSELKQIAHVRETTDANLTFHKAAYAELNAVDETEAIARCDAAGAAAASLDELQAKLGSGISKQRFGSELIRRRL
jgi:hypothetical protein